MSRKESKDGLGAEETGAPRGSDEERAGRVRASGWQERRTRLSEKRFPVPGRWGEPVRVCLDREAYGELTGHAKESLDAEVCGVLVGRLYEDSEGAWVKVDGAVRGTATKQGGTHVTYTQETWEEIYKVKDQKYPKLDIVGWYHSHPGFGVTFSDMDLFIQSNFFAGVGRVALVTDPLGGDEAMCVNTEHGIEHVSRFWVDGRERICRVPADEKTASGTGISSSPEIERSLKAVEERLSQLLQATEEQKTGLYRFLTFVGVLLLVAVVGWIAVYVYTGVLARSETPKLRGVKWLPLPVGADGEQVLVGVGIHEWKVPPELEQKMAEDLLKRYLSRLEEERGARADKGPAGEEGGRKGDRELDGEHENTANDSAETGGAR